MIRIGSIGYNHTHKKDFCANNPNGPGAWLFLLIKSDAILTLGEKTYTVLPGTVVIISPWTPCSYKAKKDIYADDWFYFLDMEGDGIEDLKRMGIDIDKPISIGHFTEVSKLIYILATEFYSANIYHVELVELYTKILFKTLSRRIIEGCLPENDLMTERMEDIHYIRTWIYREPEAIPSVGEIGQRFGMSLSSLEHLYKKAFKVNIKQDIIKSRIDLAKRLLLSTKFSVAEVGAKCGYQNCYVFMRQFKQSVGITPTEYRKRQAVGNE